MPSVATVPNATAELEDEAITIIREVAAECARPVLLFSGGKDSVVMLHLAYRAFWPARIPFPVMHVDTGHNFDEVIEFRDRTVARFDDREAVVSCHQGARMTYAEFDAAIDRVASGLLAAGLELVAPGET